MHAVNVGVAEPRPKEGHLPNLMLSLDYRPLGSSVPGSYFLGASEIDDLSQICTVTSNSVDKTP